MLYISVVEFSFVRGDNIPRTVFLSYFPITWDEIAEIRPEYISDRYRKKNIEFFELKDRRYYLCEMIIVAKKGEKETASLIKILKSNGINSVIYELKR